MPQHVPALDVRFAALRTVVVLLAGVRPLMGHQMALADEVLRAHVAPEGPLHRLPLGVAPLVEQQVALERERLAALIALERALPGMRPAHMIDQVLLPGKRLVAHIATVGIVPAVLAHVVVEVLLARERLVAVLAFVRRISGMEPDVIFEVFFTGEGLATVLTPVRRFSGMQSDVIG